MFRPWGCGGGEGGVRVGGWHPRIKRTRVFVIPCRGQKSGCCTPLKGVQPQRSKTGPFTVPFRVLKQKKNMPQDQWCLGIDTLGVEKHFKSHPHNRILVSRRGPFLFIWEFPPPPHDGGFRQGVTAKRKRLNHLHKRVSKMFLSFCRK